MRDAERLDERQGLLLIEVEHLLAHVGVFRAADDQVPAPAAMQDDADPLAALGGEVEPDAHSRKLCLVDLQHHRMIPRNSDEPGAKVACRVQHGARPPPPVVDVHAHRPAVGVHDVPRHEVRRLLRHS